MNNRKWTKEEVDLLISMYSDNSTESIAKKLNRPKHGVYHMAYKLKLRKSDSFLNSEKSGRIQKGTDKGKDGRFKKGSKPWNTGIKGLQIGGTETQFKKGSLPHNTKEDGAISIRIDKGGRDYKWIRVSLGKWEMLHVYTWKQHNGKVIHGHIITFKDGDRMNCSIENLRMITLKQHMEETRLKDTTIATMLSHNAGNGNINKELRSEILNNHKDLIEAKRQTLLLSRNIKNHEKQISKNDQ
jgi:hypothetical protein